MAALVQLALHTRRLARASLGYLVAAACAVLLLLGSFRVEQLRPEHGAVAIAWLAVLLARLLDARARRKRATPLDLELGLLLLVAIEAVVQHFGGLDGIVSPLVYALAAAVASLAERRIVVAWLACAIGLDAALHVEMGMSLDVYTYGPRAAFMVVFATLGAALTHVEIARVRTVAERELHDDKARAREDARLFRLVTTPSEFGRADPEQLARSSVEEVHQGLYFALELLKRTLDLHTSVLLLQDGDGRALRIAELVTDSDDIADGPFPLGAGAVGAAHQRGVVMNLSGLKPGYSGICYYQHGACVGSMLALPVRDQGVVRGVLCVDRIDERAFSADEEASVGCGLAHVVRVLQNERVFMQLERSKREHAVLRHASEALGAALNEHAVLQAALDAAAQIAPYDFAAVTSYDAATRLHNVRAAVGQGAEALRELRYRDNTSLTAMAVQNRHYLPYRGEYDADSQVVFTRKEVLVGMQSLLVLPLVVREVAIGTLTLAARRREAFDGAVRPTLTALANQLAVAMSNAASVKRLEELATTDGLTGCFNKRYFHEQLHLKLTAAERFGRKLSLVIADLDHFKTVNDTYGHATGDAVIRELGAVLMRLKRETDIVARFGGEELCVLCEETDTKGAARLAERVRREMEQTVFDTELGRLAVTCSIGVATYPDHALDRESLFEASDRALYEAKHAGRNCVAQASPARLSRRPLAPVA